MPAAIKVLCIVTNIAFQNFLYSQIRFEAFREIFLDYCCSFLPTITLRKPIHSVFISTEVNSLPNKPQTGGKVSPVYRTWISKTRKQNKNPPFGRGFWSEWRESNSRPLEPHSSALPNCAITRTLPPVPAAKIIIRHPCTFVNVFFHFHGMIFSCRPAVPVSDCFCIGRNRTG